MLFIMEEAENLSKRKYASNLSFRLSACSLTCNCFDEIVGFLDFLSLGVFSPCYLQEANTCIGVYI